MIVEMLLGMSGIRHYLVVATVDGDYYIAHYFNLNFDLILDCF